MAVSEEERSAPKSRPSSSSSRTAHHYLAKCILRGSVVLQVLYGHIRSEYSDDVVFGKETSIELVMIGEDGIVQSVCDQIVFGTIKDIAVLPWNKKFHARDPQMWYKDLLIVLSDSGKLSLLTFCNEMNRFFPVTHVHLSNPGNIRDLPGRMLAVDCSGCFIAVSAYEDQLALFSMSISKGRDIIDERIKYPSESEGTASTSKSTQRSGICGTIWSMCFISQNSRQPSNQHNPVLAILLNRRGALLNEFLLLEWNIKEHAIYPISKYVKDGNLAHNIVEVPNSDGLVFLFRVGDALLMDLRDAHNPCCIYRTSLSLLPNAVEEQAFVEEFCRLQDVDDPVRVDSDSGSTNSNYNYICSWTWEPKNNKDPKMIFCVNTGEFFMIEINLDAYGLEVNLSQCLYKGPPCKALMWLDGGYLAALVEMGDGMVLKFVDGRLCYTSPIQNIAPILDMTIVDCHDEKQGQIFACCGVSPEGSLRIIRSGISVEKLLTTAPIYQGVTGTWTVRMKILDLYHSFLVLSFFEDTRILSLGLSFTDVTDSIGFQSNVCTLACGLVSDGLLVQIHQSEVRLCLPTKAAHPEGIKLSSPICTSWSPDNLHISLGAVGHNLIVVSTSNPCFLSILGFILLSDNHYEIYEMQRLGLQSELSCISIPRQKFEPKKSNPSILVYDNFLFTFPSGYDIKRTFVIGTHRPSVEVFSFSPDRGVRHIACGTISLTSSIGTARMGCVPQDVELVFVDKFYVLAGLRNGMLLRFEWLIPDHYNQCTVSPPINVNTSLSSINLVNSFDPQMSEVNALYKIDDLPTTLQLISIRHIGTTPVYLVPLGDSLDGDIIVLSDRPWLLHSARHSLSYSSISFYPSTHVTPVCFVECPKGLVFVAEDSLHLVEMVPSRRLNVQKFHLEGTPRKVLYHSDSGMLLVMRTDLNSDVFLSDICCVDPQSGSVLSSFILDPGETGKSMELVRVGSEQVLVVGTSLSSGPVIMPNGEAKRIKGRLLILCLEHVRNSDSGSVTFCSKAGSSSQRTSPCHDGNKLDEHDVWKLRVAVAIRLKGSVLAICSYLDRYFLASVGNAFIVCGFPDDKPQIVRKYAEGSTRFMITSLTSHCTRIAVGDCRDGILLYSYHEDTRKLELLYCDPSQRLVADCILMDADTAVVSDREGSISVLCSNHLEVNASSERNLTLCSAYYMSEVAMSIRKCGKGLETNVDSSKNTIVFSTLLGSTMILIRLSREEYELFEAVQARLVIHPLTAPILGNNHEEFRTREIPVGAPKILDGDMLTQFLELTCIQQEAVLSNESSLKPLPPSYLGVDQVVQLLELVHKALI